MTRPRSQSLGRTMLFWIALCFILMILLATEIRYIGQTRYVKNMPSSSPEESDIENSHVFEETILRDGTWRFDYRRPDSNSELIVLAVTHDETSWSVTYPDNRQRHASDFFDLVGRQVSLSNTSIGIFTASKEVYAQLKRQAVRRSIGRISVFYHPDTQSYPYSDRHQEAVQYERRSTIASLRNKLMARALRDEDYIFWLDADVVDMSDDLVSTMISQAERNPKQVGAITARCQQGSNPNYDLNAWYIDRAVKGITKAIAEAQRQTYSEKLAQTRHYVPHQIKGLGNDEMGKLDSVGGTSLLLRADLVRKGLIFPPFKIVGTTWAQGGWAAQETEGICYMAEKIDGSECRVLGGTHYTRHAV